MIKLRVGISSLKGGIQLFSPSSVLLEKDNSNMPIHSGGLTYGPTVIIEKLLFKKTNLLISRKIIASIGCNTKHNLTKRKKAYK